MQQYWDFKKEHLDKIVFFQLGDFFELFYEDAQIASKLLDLTLTHRGHDDEGRIPMAGVPVHTIENYIKKLLAQHYCVVLCTQKTAGTESQKGPIVRKIQRIYTPGTSYETELANPYEWNYLAAYHEDEKNGSLCWVDLCEGVIYWKQDLKEKILLFIDKIQPKEILYSSKHHFTHNQGQKIAPWYFEETESWPYIEKALPQWGLYRDARMHLSTWRSIGALCRYVQEYVGAPHTMLRTILPYYDKQEIAIDLQTRRNLMIEPFNAGELCLIDIFSKELHSSMGIRLLKRWIASPSLNISELDTRYSDQQWWKNQKKEFLNLSEHLLNHMPDFQKLCARICSRTVRPREMVHLGQCLAGFFTIVNETRHSPFDLSAYENKLKDLQTEITDTLLAEPAIHFKEGMIFQIGWDKELDDAYNLSNDHHAVVDSYLKDLEKTHNLTLKIGFNNLIGHYIELSKTQSDKAPLSFKRIQTLKHTERYTTLELKKLDESISMASFQLKERQHTLWEQLLDKTHSVLSDLYSLSDKLSYMDVCLSLYKLQNRLSYCIPSFTKERLIAIEQARHPLIEHISKKPFMPNNIFLEKDKPFLLISGPNMGGKSTYMRQAALCIFMAYCGLGVPAHSCKLGPIDRIFTRMGAEDRLALSQSTFMVELSEMAKILRESTELSAVFIDEMGRGTSTYDGLSLAQSCAEHLIEKTQCFTMFSTHYQELGLLSKRYPNNIQLMCFEGKIFDNKMIFNYEIKKGHIDQSFGLYVAQEAGLPRELLSRAWTIHSQFAQHNMRASQEDNNEIVLIKNRTTPQCCLCSDLKTWDLEQMSPKDLWKHFSQWQEKIAEPQD